MPFKIAFRTSRISVFRRYLNELIDAKLAGANRNEIVLCSAYWSSRILGLDSNQLAGKLTSKFDRVILLSDSLSYGGSSPSDGSYKKFVEAIRLARSGAAPVVESRISKYPDEHFWHGKVALRLCDDKVIAALIGSSNMSKPAYDVSTRPSSTGALVDYFNFETDVLLWRDCDELNRLFTAKQVRDVENWRGRGDGEGMPLEVFGTEISDALLGRGILLPSPQPTEMQLNDLLSFILKNSDHTGWPK